MKNSKKFLTAEWRRLIMANYRIDADRLRSYLPAYTELDTWNGNHYVSLVGFMFMKTKVLGFSIPFHTDFPEVNLRFYVRYKEGGQWKRGVVFIREIVSKPALAYVANKLFNERYLTMPMRYAWQDGAENLLTRYEWKTAEWHRLEVITGKDVVDIGVESKEEFITEHYWGYTSLNPKQSGEYNVEHPRWKVYPVKSYRIECDFPALYGNHFAALQGEEPESIFLAEGSPVTIYSKRIIDG